jgi:hypothetical protein
LGFEKFDGAGLGGSCRVTEAHRDINDCPSKQIDPNGNPIVEVFYRFPCFLENHPRAAFRLIHVGELKYFTIIPRDVAAPVRYYLVEFVADVG